MNKKSFFKGLGFSLLLVTLLISMTGCGVLGGAAPVAQVDKGPDLAATAAAEATRIIADAQAAAAAADTANDNADTVDTADTAVPAATADQSAAQTGSGKVLIVGDDELSGHYDWTSADELAESLTNLGYSVDTWGTWDDGTPTVETMNDYDAIFWSTGDDCCDSPPIDSVNVIKAYLDQGGRNLLLEGGSIAYAYPNSTFLKNYVGINHYGWNPVSDIQTQNHPLTAGMDGTIELDEPSGIRPDIVTAYTGTDMVIVRGPASAGAGQGAMTAYEFDGNQVFFSCIPLQWLPNPQLKILLGNMMDWFLNS